MFKKLILVLAITAVCFAGVSTTSNRMPAYTCNGALTQFTFNFPVNQSTDLDVVLYNVATATATTLVKDTHYTISATNNDFSSGGTITTLSTYSSNYKIFLVRSTDFTQGTTLISDSGVLRTASLVSALDKQVLISQDLSERVGRCITFPVQDVNVSNTLPDSATRANKYLAFNSLGVPVATSGTTSSVATSVFGESLVGTANAASAQTLLGLLDEDTLVSDSNTYPPSQQSVKAYVDSGTVTMTNKTLTSPTINSPTITNPTITGTTSIGNGATLTTPILTSPTLNTGVSGTAIDTNSQLAANSDTKLATQKAVKSYVTSHSLTAASSVVWNDANLAVNTWRDVDVHAIVGSNVALCYVEANSADTIYIAVKPKGQGSATASKHYPSASGYGMGAGELYLQAAGYYGYMVVMTDSNGIFQVATLNSTVKFTIKLLGYIK